MLENSIILVDNSLDDNFEIVDDGCGNIVVKNNLFSRVQEVRPFYNLINTAVTNSYCDYYYTDIETRQAGSGLPYGLLGTGSYLPPTGCLPW
jgi:hypothetical protein